MNGTIQDQRRRAAYRNNPAWFIEECEALGLFTVRMPAFAQVFFYKFTTGEISNQADQPTSSSSSKRAAEAYLISGIQLESTCGVSDVWY